jgi:endonuclease III-like uncharacterized protein
MSIEETIANYIGRNQKWLDLKGGLNPIILQTIEAQVCTYKTAPRDIHQLKMKIALKTKEYNNCTKWPERDILRTEIDTLATVLYVIQAHEAKAIKGKYYPE